MAPAPAPVIEAEPEASFADKLWALPTLYKNEDNPVLKKLALIGRYHGQYYYSDANTGKADDWENRRFRAGFAAEFGWDLSFEMQFNLPRTNELLTGGRFLRNIEDMVLEWAPGDIYSVSIGKQKTRFSQEWWVSSKRILTFERSLATNLLHPGKTWGINVAADYGRFDWMVGVTSGGLETDWLWPDFDAGWGYGASVGYEVTDETYVRLDYFYNDQNGGNVGFRPREHVFSLNTTNSWDRFGLNTDLLYGTSGLLGGDLFSIILMPTYDINDKFKIVTRYQYATSDSSGGVTLPGRYAQPAIEDGSSRTGDNYHALYAGLNWYIYGDKLKIMNGFEWQTMGGDADYNGWTFLTGVRLYF